ncbi:hypothetical protein ACQJBY_002349 [Aegilops geniculata]
MTVSGHFLGSLSSQLVVPLYPLSPFFLPPVRWISSHPGPGHGRRRRLQRRRRRKGGCGSEAWGASARQPRPGDAGRRPGPKVAAGVRRRGPEAASARQPRAGDAERRPGPERSRQEFVVEGPRRSARGRQAQHWRVGGGTGGTARIVQRRRGAGCFLFRATKATMRESRPRPDHPSPIRQVVDHH